MGGNVTRLKLIEGPAMEQASQDVIEALLETLQAARAGDLTSIALVSVSREGVVSHHFACAEMQSFHLMSGVAMMHASMMNIANSNADSAE